MKIMPLFLAAAAGIALAQPKQPMNTADVHSFANPEQVSVSHVDLDLTVRFDTKTISGTAVLTIDNKKKATTLVLDTRDLSITGVTLDDGKTSAEYSLGSSVPFLGAPLSISITPRTKSVTIAYSTSPGAAALQWLEPSQTAGKKKPFLYTQSEPILARTWVPCQDGPGVRISYSAVIHTPPDLLAVMGAAGNQTEKNADGVYRFEMKQPIPSYLLALAVGDLVFRPVSDRCGVYAEPSMADKAAYEFSDMEKMLHAAEELYGPYRWERYDIIVLPPSFPYGGMENPRLTFATPTVIAGDRSLVSLVAHELAHSWSGNLVTNATWNDFWLNEGFTVYVEQRIMEKLYGREFSEMQASLALRDLTVTMDQLGRDSADTKLKLDLRGRDPDDGATDIAYDKGYFFLRLCEETVGRERWDAFLREYFDANAFQSMTTERFVATLHASLIDNNSEVKKRINDNEWIYGTGLPANCPQPHSTEFDRVDAQRNAFLSGTPAPKLDTHSWTTQHWLHFIQHLPDSVRLEQLIELDYTFNFTRTGNAEIACEWYTRCIKSGYETAFGPLRSYLTTVGRRKLVKPLYTELAKTPAGKKFALDVYAAARPGYHSVTATTIDGILGYAPQR